ncbi:MED6-domain-containing protein, partial [Fistulina hepatica ATCC 64428]
MDVNDLHPSDDYSHRFFIWHEWIQANGPLTVETVFEYFASSMFYDKQSNNQVLRMQTMHTGMPILNEAEELKRFTGIEFAVVHCEPPSLFIIHKRDRISPDEVRPLAVYFIINNRIYEAPDLYTVLSNRLHATLHSLQTSLDILRDHRPDYTPRTGFVWPIFDTAAVEDETKKHHTDFDVIQEPNQSQSMTSTSQGSTAAQKLTTTGVKRIENNQLLLNAMRTTGRHSNAAFAQTSS